MVNNKLLNNKISKMSILIISC